MLFGFSPIFPFKHRRLAFCCAAVCVYTYKLLIIRLNTANAVTLFANLRPSSLSLSLSLSERQGWRRDNRIPRGAQRKRK